MNQVTVRLVIRKVNFKKSWWKCLSRCTVWKNGDVSKIHQGYLTPSIGFIVWFQILVFYTKDLCTYSNSYQNEYFHEKSITPVRKFVYNHSVEIQDFSSTQILREINFGHFEGLKTAILTISVFNFWQFCDIFKIQKIKNQSLQNSWNNSFWIFCNQPNLISRKIRVAGKLLDFRTVTMQLTFFFLCKKKFV